MKKEQTVFQNVGIQIQVPAYEDGTDSVPKRRHTNSDAGELPRRKHTTICKMLLKYNVQNVAGSCGMNSSD
jgi:hypothetical protein